MVLKGSYLPFGVELRCTKAFMWVLLGLASCSRRMDAFHLMLLHLCYGGVNKDRPRLQGASYKPPCAAS